MKWRVISLDWRLVRGSCVVVGDGVQPVATSSCAPVACRLARASVRVGVRASPAHALVAPATGQQTIIADLLAACMTAVVEHGSVIPPTLAVPRVTPNVHAPPPFPLSLPPPPPRIHRPHPLVCNHQPRTRHTGYAPLPHVSCTA
jgi:hypothetical protein